MKQPSPFKHFRDVLILPFSVTVVIPLLIYNPEQRAIPDSLGLKGLGIILGILGIALAGYTISLFARFGKGTLAPWEPTQQLIITGPYRYCRNPMITGVACILTGETLFFHSTNFLFLVIIFFLINTLYFIYKEEPDMHKRFGEDYLHYKKHVPRWIPNWKPYKKDTI